MTMTNNKIKTAIIIGSLRKGSFSRMIAKTLIATAPQSMNMEILEIGQLSMYNQDLDELPPATWTEFRNRIKSYDSVIFVTPEYNRSVPGVLKNAIDIASRPYGQNVFNGKPSAIISVSIGTIGGFGANHHLRQSLVFLNMPTMQQPEAYISNAAQLFEANGNLSNESTRTFLIKFLNAFIDWVSQNKQKSEESPVKENSAQR